MSGSLLNASAELIFVAIPSEVIWSYSVFGAVFAIGLVTIFLRSDWQKTHGFDRRCASPSGRDAARSVAAKKTSADQWVIT